MLKFYKCVHCGQIVAIVKETGVPIICCGDEMKEIKANSSDGAFEKHVPTLKIDNNKAIINVGSIDHPMSEAHYIEWIAIETENGNQRKILSYKDEPKATFYLKDDDKVLRVYAYCNLHGLYVLEV